MLPIAHTSKYVIELLNLFLRMAYPSYGAKKRCFHNRKIIKNRARIAELGSCFALFCALGWWRMGFFRKISRQFKNTAIHTTDALAQSMDQLTRSPFKNLERETLLGGLCKHLQQIGIAAQLLEPNSSEALVFPGFLGCVKIENRNLDMILVDWTWFCSGSEDSDSSDILYRYFYVVWLNVEGLEGKLKADFKSYWHNRCSLKRNFVRFEQTVPSQETSNSSWSGGELAHLLRGDPDLTYALYCEGLDALQIRPDKHHRCVLMQHVHYWTLNGNVDVGPDDFRNMYVREEGKHLSSRGRKQFPTREAFEAYDRIAYMIRRVAKASLNS